MKTILVLILLSMTCQAAEPGALDPCTDTRLPIVSADPKVDSWVNQYLKIFAANSGSFDGALEASDACAFEISRRLFSESYESQYVDTLKLLNVADQTGENGMGPLALRLQQDWETRYLWTYYNTQQDQMGSYRLRTGLMALMAMAFTPIKFSKSFSSGAIATINTSRAVLAAGSMTLMETSDGRIGVDRRGIHLYDNYLRTPPPPSLYVEFSDPAAADVFAIKSLWLDEYRSRYQAGGDLASGFAIFAARRAGLFTKLFERLGIAETGALAGSGAGGARMAKVGRGGAWVGIFLGLDFLINGVVMDAYEAVPVEGKLNELQLKRSEYEIAAQKLRALGKDSPAYAEQTRAVYRLAVELARNATELSQLLSRPYLKAYLAWMRNDTILDQVGQKLQKPTDDDIQAARMEKNDYSSSNDRIASAIYRERVSQVSPTDLEAYQTILKNAGFGSDAPGSDGGGAGALALLQTGTSPEILAKTKIGLQSNLQAELRSAVVTGNSAASNTMLGMVANGISGLGSYLYGLVFGTKGKAPDAYADPSFTPYLWFQFFQPVMHRNLKDVDKTSLERRLSHLTPFDPADRATLETIIKGLLDLPEGTPGRLSPRFADNLRQMMDMATTQLNERLQREGREVAKLDHEQKLALWQQAIQEYRANLDHILSIWLQQNNFRAIDSRPRADHVLILAAATLRNVLKEADLVGTPLYASIEYMTQTTLVNKAGEYHYNMTNMFGEIPAEAQDLIDKRLWSILKYNSAWVQVYDPRGESPSMDSQMYVSY